MKPLIDADELARVLNGDDRPAVVDVRWKLGRDRAESLDEYLEGHLPGAVFLDLDSALSDPVVEDRRGGRHPMPSRDRVQEAFRAAGIRAGQGVVFYDAASSLGAARAWWVATYFGVPARVLDGGLSSWTGAGHPTEQSGVTPERGDVVLTEGGRELYDAEGVLARLQEGGQVIDSRPADRYRGENEVIDPVAGHIPGALSVPALSVLDSEGRFLDADGLRPLLEAAGVDPSAGSVIYCGSGVQASHLALALEAADLAPEAPGVYIGSWSDWVSDPSRPVATGPEAG